MEQIGLHLTGSPELFVTCAQIRITSGGGSENRPRFLSPGASKKTGVAPFHYPAWIWQSVLDPGLMLNIFWSVPTTYTVGLESMTHFFVIFVIGTWSSDLF
jgi:hypothetical protein